MQQGSTKEGRRKMSTAQTEYDAVVIGGGPGGSCAAGFLARFGWKVVLFEKERFPRHRIGESLLPATTMGILNKLGAMDLIEKHGFTKKYGGTFLWGKEDKPWTFNFYRTSEADATFGDHPTFLHSFQVERMIFDKLLLDHARALGAEVHQASAGATFSASPSSTVGSGTSRSPRSSPPSVSSWAGKSTTT